MVSIMRMTIWQQKEFRVQRIAATPLLGQKVSLFSFYSASKRSTGYTGTLTLSIPICEALKETAWTWTVLPMGTYLQKHFARGA